MLGFATHFLVSSFFFFIFNDFSETNYLRIGWTDFLQSFHRMKAFWVQMIDLDLFFRYLKGRCHGNRFCEKMVNSPFSLLWQSETEWDIATSMRALTAQMRPVSCENFVKFGPVTPELTELICERLV